MAPAYAVPGLFCIFPLGKTTMESNVMENAFPFIAKYISNYTSLALLTFHPGASICKRFFMEFFPDDIFHMKHSDLKEIESTEQIEVRN